MITAPYLAEAVRAIRTPRCEDCAHCRLATHYGDDPRAQVHFAICRHLESGFGWYWKFADDVRDDPKLCGPGGRWHQPRKEGKQK